MGAVEDLLKQGKPAEALKALEQEVRAKPADPKLRIALFQAMCVEGQWERALTQLGVIAEMDPSAMLMVQLCRPAIQCERLRSEVFKGQRDPMLLGQPSEWMVWMIQAGKLTAQENHAAATDLRSRALDAAPTTSGTINGEPFEWIMDADSRLGPILEALIDGRYFWVPFSRLRSIEIEKPVDLRDAVWIPARVVVEGGGEKVALIPSRYAGSWTHPDGNVRLSRTVDWSHPDEHTTIGSGQRVLLTDAGEYPLLRVTKLELSPQA